MRVCVCVYTVFLYTHRHIYNIYKYIIYICTYIFCKKRLMLHVINQFNSTAKYSEKVRSKEPETNLKRGLVTFILQNNAGADRRLKRIGLSRSED